MENIMQTIHIQKLQDQINILGETIEIYKQYIDVQKQQIEALREQLNKSMELNDDLLDMAKQAIRGGETNWVNS